MNLYEALADRVARSIERGALKVGDRLGSVRQVARQEGVSVATVVQAYVVLEDRGLIEVRPQSGHYVKAPPTHTLEEPRCARPSIVASKVSVQDQVKLLYRSSADRSIAPLGPAYLSAELLPTEKINRALASIARSAGAIGVAYDPPPGCLALRRQIARRSVQWGAPIHADDLVMTIGAMEALTLSLRATTQAGDTIAIETPAYHGLLQLIETMQLRAVEIPVHARTGMDLDALAAALKRHKIKAVLAVPNFNNPTGSLMPDEEKRSLVSLLARREIPLIEDDVYGDLHHGEARPRPAKAFDEQGLVLLCGSFSKTIAPGYRAGFVAPGRYRDRVELLKFAETLASPTLPQLAIAELLESGGYDHHMRSVRRRLREQLDQHTAAVARSFPEGTRMSRPQGGFVLWIELPPKVDAEELQRRALERKVSIAPGTIFSAKPRFSSFARINVGNPFTETIARAVETVGQIACDLARARRAS